MAEKIRLGFVGCGGIAESHLKGLIRNSYAEVAAFCDVRLSQAEEISKKYGAADAQTFTDAQTMLDKADLDAVYFCLPPFAHGAEIEAAKRRIPFFVEKPINLYLDQAKRIAEAVEEKNILTSVGYMNRYRKGVKKVRALLGDDPPILILGGWIGRTPSPESGANIMKWWIRKEKSGGQFHEQVTHTVDLTRFLCGEISEVHAFPAVNTNKTVPENYNIEDASVVSLKFMNSAVGSLWASCSADGGGGGVSLSVYASRITVLFTGWEHSLRLLRKDTEAEEMAGEPNVFAIEDEAFVEAVRNNDSSKVMCSYSDALKTLEVTLAANESMATGSAVKIHHD
ncbi:MAG: Gfo/Idh/MocA family oxidoreductase [Candidatus Bathyarchaeota archaeon]|nr:Gfo/Idh/MocA family oxidoreductase [Candidatus Bathyarchaeota archaeon]